MLSEKLQALRDILARFEDGIEMAEEAVSAILVLLDGFIAEAEELEARAAGAPLPPAVERLARKLARQGVRVGPAKHSPRRRAKRTKKHSPRRRAKRTAKHSPGRRAKRIKRETNMLSDDIQLIADLLEDFRDIGVHLEARIVVGMIARLNELSARAHELERQIVPAAARVAEGPGLPDNVVVLARRR